MKNLRKLLIACATLAMITGCASTTTSTVKTSVTEEVTTQEEDNKKPTVEFTKDTIEANEGTELSKLDLVSNIKSVTDSENKDIEKVDKLEDGKAGYDY